MGERCPQTSRTLLRHLAHCFLAGAPSCEESRAPRATELVKAVSPPGCRYRVISHRLEAPTSGTARMVPKQLLGTWGRSLHIDRRRPKAGPDDDELALLVAIVAFAMNSTLGDVDKITSYCADDLPATRSTLQSQCSPRDVDAGVVITVVMPARGHSWGCAHESGPHALDVDRSLAKHPWSWVSLYSLCWSNYPCGIRCRHCTSLARETSERSVADSDADGGP